MSVQVPETAVRQPGLAKMDPRTLHILNAIQANARGVTERDTESAIDKAVNQTFGAGHFRISTKGGDSADYNSIDGNNAAILELREREAQHVNAVYAEAMERNHEAVMEMFEETSEWLDYHTSYTSQYSFNPYTGTYDITDAKTRDYVSNAEIMYADDGEAVSIDDGKSCMRLGKDDDGQARPGELLLRSKQAMDSPIDVADEHERDAVTKAEVSAENGFIDYKGSCIELGSVEGQRVLNAKAALEEDPTGQTKLAKVTRDDATKLEAEAAPAAEAKQAEPAPVSASAQGNDFNEAMKAVTGLSALSMKGPVAATPAFEIPAMEVAAVASPAQTFKTQSPGPAL